MLRLSDMIEKSIENAMADCKSVADISTLSRSLIEEHPELRLEIDGLTEVLVARAARKGLAVRLDK